MTNKNLNNNEMEKPPLQVLTTLREVVRQGGGKSSSYAFISPLAWIDEHSTIEDSAEVWDDAKIFNSNLFNNAKVFGSSVVRNSKLFEYVKVHNSKLIDVRMFNTSEVNDSQMWNVDLMDNAIVSGRSIVVDSELSDNCRVGNEAVLNNVELSDNATVIGKGTMVAGESSDNKIVIGYNTRIIEGRWFRAPYYIHGDYFSLTEGVNDTVLIGCLQESLSGWYRFGLKILKNYGLPEESYEWFFNAMKRMEQWKLENPSPTK